MTAGDRIRIAGHVDSVPDINGDHTVAKVVDSDTVKIDVDITTIGAGGTATQIPGFWRVRAGMRVVATVPRVGKPDLEVYGRITAVDNANGILTVDEWIGGTPDASSTYAVNGWVIDLPYSQKVRQEFAPEQVVHSLWRKRLDSRFYGYNYRCLVNYDQWIDADTLFYMRHALNPAEDDELVIVPYVDKPGYNYAVIFDDAMALELFGKGGGHGGFALTFRGKHLVSFPVSGEGYGWNYGYEYGIGK
jgi:hypothetical protein